MLSLRSGTLTCLATLLLVAPACDSPAAEPSKATQKSEVKQIVIEQVAAKPDDALTDGSSTIFKLGEAKIMREGHPDRAFELHADGSVTLSGRPFGTLEAEGRFLAPSGAALLTVHADGSVEGENGPSGISLTAGGGKLSAPDLEVEISIEADGSVAVTTTGARAHLLGPDGPELKTEGCTEELRPACTVVALTYLMALGNPDSEKAP